MMNMKLLSVVTPPSIYHLPKSSRAILKFCANKKNSSVSPLSNYAIFNFYKYKFSDVGYLRNLMLTPYLSYFASFLILINVIKGGSMCTCTVPWLQLFLCETLLIVDGFVWFGFLGIFFAKCHIPKVVISISRKTIHDNIIIKF